jgi:DNA-binding LacI/PurR family transcriptional regulator
MGYTPNAIAQSMLTKQTSTIGLVVTSISDPFWGDVMKGVEEVARAAGFSVFLSASHNDPDQEMMIIETFRRRRVDGILVAGSRITAQYRGRLERIQIPTVLINSQAESQNELLHWVSVDDNTGTKLAIEYLLQLGHRSIGYLGVGNRPRANQQRLEGYRNTLAAAGIAGHDEWVATTSGLEASFEEDVGAGQSLLPSLLNAGVTAVFCYNDMVALGALLACQERGIAVPGQLSIIGYDDIKFAAYLTPSLTTIHQPKAQLGRLATQVMLDLLSHQPGQNYLLEPTIIPRASTAPPVDG